MIMVSPQNVLAVGLGTCVYLWTASNSKVTKLCDLGPNDSVCSVQWTRFGTEHSARESEPWEVIRRELVSWHGIQESYHQAAETETSFNMISESRAIMSANSWGTNLKSAV
ncbi:unnamed protein product [Arabidopsis halleri]